MEIAIITSLLAKGNVKIETGHGAVFLAGLLLSNEGHL
jgi:hypothetical protein